MLVVVCRIQASHHLRLSHTRKWWATLHFMEQSKRLRRRADSQGRKAQAVMLSLGVHLRHTARRVVTHLSQGESISYECFTIGKCSLWVSMISVYTIWICDELNALYIMYVKLWMEWKVLTKWKFPSLICCLECQSFFNPRLFNVDIVLTHPCYFKWSGYRLDLEPTPDNHIMLDMVTGVFDSSGGTLSSEPTGVSIYLPQNAIPAGVNQEIYFKVCGCWLSVRRLCEDEGFGYLQILNAESHQFHLSAPTLLLFACNKMCIILPPSLLSLYLLRV